MSKHMKKIPEGWVIFGKVKHMFEHEVAGALINIFDVTFGAKQGRMTHQHFLFPAEMEEEAKSILVNYGYREFSMEEHNEDRKPVAPPPIGEKDTYIPMIIYRAVGMMDPAEAKALSSLEKKSGKNIGYGGGYDVIWKTVFLHDRGKLKELLPFLSNHGIQYILPDKVGDPTAVKEE